MTLAYKSLRLPAAAAMRGFDQVNDEHENIAQMIDQLRAKVFARGRMAFADIKPEADDIAETMRLHFLHEEDVMAELRYPALDEHRLHHKACLVRFQELVSGVASEGFATVNTIDDLFSTLLDDVLKADLGLKTYLYEKGLIV